MPAIDRTETLAVFAGGVIGAVVRTVLVRSIPHAGTEWPWATFCANLSGAFVLGVVAARFPRGLGRAGAPRALLGTGFCGALTTFSTLQLELVLMIAAGCTGLAAGYAGASVWGGLAAVWAGDRLARSQGWVA